MRYNSPIMFAIIETGGKQYRVSEGDVVTIEKLPKANVGGEVVFDKVLLIDDGKTTTLGDPYIKDATISALFEKEGKGKKIIVQKFKSKSRYQRRLGHRQSFAKVKIKAAA